MAIDINGDGLIAVGGTSTTQGRVRLAEDTDNGTNYVELTANAAITTNRTVTFPDENIDFTTGLSATLGGTGLTSAGTNGNVLTSNGSAWVSQAAAAGGGDYIMQVFTTPGTWTKPAGLKAIKVTVVGGGGSGGGINVGARDSGGAGGGTAIEYIDAPAIPGPQPYTVGAASPSPAAPAAGSTGNSSSFGSPALCSATGGAGAPSSSNTRSAGGAGSGGTINIPGQESTLLSLGPGCAPVVFGTSGGSTLGFGTVGGGPSSALASPGASYGYGAGGFGYIPGPGAGRPGGPGVIIVEEFY